MTGKFNPLQITLAVTALAAGLLFDGDFDRLFTKGSLVSGANARVGRPATPGSVAGVARRTTYRTVRRSTIYRATLPTACVQTSVNGASYWHCGGTYYQPYNGQYVVVYIN